MKTRYKFFLVPCGIFLALYYLLLIAALVSPIIGMFHMVLTVPVAMIISQLFGVYMNLIDPPGEREYIYIVDVLFFYTFILYSHINGY